MRALLLAITVCAAGRAQEDPHLARLQQAVLLQNEGRVAEALRVYEAVLNEAPEHPDALHLLGLAALAAGDNQRAEVLVRRASALRPNDPTILSNLGEVLRASGDPHAGVDVLRRAVQINPRDLGGRRNLIAALWDAQLFPEFCKVSMEMLDEIGVSLDSPERAANKDLHFVERRARFDVADSAQRHRCGGASDEDAFRWFEVGLQAYPEDARLWIGAGVAAHGAGMLDLAAERYERAYTFAASDSTLVPDQRPAFALQARVNRAAIDHERGLSEQAIVGYENVLQIDPTHTQALNNLGAALVTVGRHDDAITILERCLLLEPNQVQALTNLAAHWANEGDLERATALNRRAIALYLKRDPRRAAGLFAREAFAIRPIVEDATAMYAARLDFARRVASLEHLLHKRTLVIDDPVVEVEHVHFYLPYPGLDDRPLQEAVARCYEQMLPHLSGPVAGLPGPVTNRRARVGFLSKLFAEHEPHGLLLEGVVQHLPRDRFYVIVLPVASPGRPAASELLRASADLVVELGLNMRENRQKLIEAKLDVLVFADMLSEPMSYFLGFTRFAPVQVCFWGNPVTTGRSSIDYFVSADRMEHPLRTLSRDEWSEQVVLLDGQGIWYRKPEIPVGLPYPSGAARVAARRVLNLPAGDWPLLLCPQSVFKLHPHFDGVVRRILEAAPTAKVVFTMGRRDSWTAVLRKRLEKALGPLQHRCIFVSRQQPGEAYLKLLAVADILLHPFPFGGSRTSADGLALGVPVVVRPTHQLRCRMAYSFYVSMGLTDKNWTLVAADTNEYVAFAARLANDAHHRAHVASAIAAKQHVIWEDRSVVLGWARFLARVSGQRPVAPIDVGMADAEERPAAADGGGMVEDVMDAEERELRAALATKAGHGMWRAEALATEAKVQQIQSKAPPTVLKDRTQPKPQEALLAASLYDAGDIAGAAAQLELLVRRCYPDSGADCPDEAKVRSDLGAQYHQSDQLVKAEVQLRRAVELEPTNGVALNNLAVTLNSLGKKEEADLVYEQALGAVKARIQPSLTSVESMVWDRLPNHRVPF